AARRGAIEGRVPGKDEKTGAAHQAPDESPAAKTVAHGAALLRLAVDFSLPPLEQALALGARAVLREVVVDQLDVGEPRRLRRQPRLAVRRHLELPGFGTELLRRRGQRPVDELPGALEVARALDDAE